MRHIWSNWCCHIANYCNILQRRKILRSVYDNGMTIIRRRTLGSQDIVVGIDITSLSSSSQLWPTVASSRLPQPNSSVVRINKKCLISSPTPHRNITPSPIITPSALSWVYIFLKLTSRKVEADFKQSSTLKSILGEVHLECCSKSWDKIAVLPIASQRVFERISTHVFHGRTVPTLKPGQRHRPLPTLPH